MWFWRTSAIDTSPIMGRAHAAYCDSDARAGKGNDDALDYCASSAHSAACTRTTNFVPPLPSGLKIEASPSRTSNQSLPNASRIFGLCETSTTLVPAGGAVAASFFLAAARRVFFLRG